MTLDRYKRLREALDKDEELGTVLLGQTGALRKVQAAAETLLALAHKALDDGNAKAQAAYDTVEVKLRATRDAALAKLQVEYRAVQVDQAALVADATKAVADAEAAVKAKRLEIEKEWGVTVPSAAPGSTIRIG